MRSARVVSRVTSTTLGGPAAAADRAAAGAASRRRTKARIGRPDRIRPGRRTEKGPAPRSGGRRAVDRAGYDRTGIVRTANAKSELQAHRPLEGPRASLSDDRVAL